MCNLHIDRTEIYDRLLDYNLFTYLPPSVLCYMLKCTGMHHTILPNIFVFEQMQIVIHTFGYKNMPLFTYT